MMDVGFKQGQSDNLPKIDSTMMAIFFQNNSDFTTAEIRGAKAERSAREIYGDNAVGYVQVKREGDICFVKGRITPEHHFLRRTAFRGTQINNFSGAVIVVLEHKGTIQYL